MAPIDSSTVLRLQAAADPADFSQIVRFAENTFLGIANSLDATNQMIGGTPAIFVQPLVEPETRVDAIQQVVGPAIVTAGVMRLGVAASSRGVAQLRANSMVAQGVEDLGSLPVSKRPATIIGASDPATGQTVLGKSRPGANGCCAEGDASMQLGVGKGANRVLNAAETKYQKNDSGLPKVRE